MLVFIQEPVLRRTRRRTQCSQALCRLKQDVLAVVERDVIDARVRNGRSDGRRASTRIV
jgi:hypothetical protein